MRDVERIESAHRRLFGLPSLGVLLAVGLVLGLIAGVAAATAGRGADSAVAGKVPIEFLLFGTTVLGVAFFHGLCTEIAAAGLVSVLVCRLLGSGMEPAWALAAEWRLFLNLAGLLLGFAVLAKLFEDSRLADLLPRWLPGSWAGGSLLLVLVAAISSFLDNIAAAMLGGVMAGRLYRGRVGTGYLAGIVAASNAGGAWSVVGDTTTTLLWIGGVGASDLARALAGSVAAVVFVAAVAGWRQQRHQPIERPLVASARLDAGRLVIVALILGGAIAANAAFGLPAAGVWAAILVGSLWRPPPWRELRRMIEGTGLLLCLVALARLMPLGSLPDPSWQGTLALGIVSAVFDNIPLTALALFQGGYDWALLAYAVGFGGSMLWFGSSAGVALCCLFPEGRDTVAWLREGWPVAAAFLLGFAVLLLLAGWSPSPIPAHAG